MAKTVPAKKITHGEAVAQELAHDAGLMASIDHAMVDVDRHRVLTLDEFAKRVEEKIEEEAAYHRAAYQSQSAD
jgi:hypothetical protein